MLKMSEVEGMWGWKRVGERFVWKVGWRIEVDCMRVQEC